MKNNLFAKDIHIRNPGHNKLSPLGSHLLSCTPYVQMLNIRHTFQNGKYLNIRALLAPYLSPIVITFVLAEGCSHLQQ